MSDYDAARFGARVARECSAFYHADKAAELQVALRAGGLTDDNRAYLAAQYEFHARRAEGYRKAMEQDA